MKTRNKLPAERAVVFACALGGLSLDETRAILREAGLPDDLPDSSWEMVLRKYVPSFVEAPSSLGKNILSPSPMGDLS